MPTTKKELDAARDAAHAQEAEAELDGGYVTVPLAGFDGVTKDVRVVPPNKWRASAMRCLRTGDLDGFMELVLHEDDFEIYEELDPDQDSFAKFTEDAATAAGDSMGKSGGRSRSGNASRRS
ncbi:hypothetical protein [Streptomyces sp. SGAir0957]